MNFFYDPDITGQFYTLNKVDSNHLIRVMRIKLGETVFVTDGNGMLFECVVTDTNPKGCQIEIVNKTPGADKRNFNLQIAIAPTKNSGRFEWFLEKSTEIGIDFISPILCDHSERKTIKVDRLNRVITAAMKQSLKSFHPRLDNLIAINDFIEKPFQGQKFIAYVDSEIENELFNMCKPNIDTLVLIGPEGDFSKEEISNAINNGFIPVKLGPSRLRTETAGIVACHTVNMVNL